MCGDSGHVTKDSLTATRHVTVSGTLLWSTRHELPGREGEEGREREGGRERREETGQYSSDGNEARSKAFHHPRHRHRETYESGSGQVRGGSPGEGGGRGREERGGEVFIFVVRHKTGRVRLQRGSAAGNAPLPQIKRQTGSPGGSPTTTPGGLPGGRPRGTCGEPGGT